MTATVPADTAVADVVGTDTAFTPEPALVRWVRSNRLFAIVLLAGVVLRVVVEAGYPPALEFYGDSPSYLYNASHLGDVNMWHPLGYPFFIWLTSPTHSLLTLTLLQHAVGVATGVLLYRLVRGLGVGAVGATIAALPILLDAYQLDVEQFVLSDTLFTFLVVVTVVASRRLLRVRSGAQAAVVGALLGATTLTRTVGMVVAVVVALVLVVARVEWSRIAAVVAACAVPVGAYALAFHATYGVYALEANSGRYLYGTVAPVAQCDPSSLPEQQQALCPTAPVATRPGSNEYVWGIYPYAPLPGDAVHRSQEAGAFARHIATTQPIDVARVVAGNVLHYFAPQHDVGPRDWFVGSWQFPLDARSPAWNISPALDGIGGRPAHGHIDTGVASLLRGYQSVVFTPGPALLLALLVGGGACCRRRADGASRQVVALLAGTGLLLLVVPSASAGFDWRYVLPAQALLVPAGVVGTWLMRDVVTRLVRRATALVAALVAAAVVIPGAVLPSVYAASALQPHRVVPVPATQPIGARLDVHVGAAELMGVRCRWDGDRPRLDGIVAFTMMASYRSGPASLVQPGNFAVSDGAITSAPAPQVRNPGVPSVLVGPDGPTATGVLYTFVRRTAGTIRYVDPVGGGAAAWSYRVTSPPDQRIGAPCTGSAPWAGAQVHSLRVTGVAPFTLSSSQPLVFGFRHPTRRARDYDLRFRLTPPLGTVGAWQYPPTWQHTTLQRQTLLNLSPGVTYCFSVRARDALNEVTDWTKPTCTTRMYDDTSLPPAPAWTATSGNSGFVNGTATAAQAKGAQLAVAGSFDQAALLVYRCPTCGAVDIYADTRLLAHLDLAARRPAVALWTSRRFPTAKTLTVRVVSDGKPVVVDGFGFA